MNNQLKKAIPMLLTGIGCIGVVVTAVLSGKASVKAHDILEKEREKKGDDLTPKEKVKAVAKEYLWTGVSGATSIGCIMGGKAIDAKTIATLTGSLYLGARKFSDYRKQVIEQYGADEDQTIMDHVKKHEQNADELICDHSDPSKGELVRYYDPVSKEFFWNTPYNMLGAECDINESFQANGQASITEFQDYAGEPHHPELESKGWICPDVIDQNGYLWITIAYDNEHVDENGEPYKSIRYVTKPVDDIHCWE